MAGGFYVDISCVTHILMILATITNLLCLMPTYYLYFSTIFQGGKRESPKFWGEWYLINFVNDCCIITEFKFYN